MKNIFKGGVKLSELRLSKNKETAVLPPLNRVQVPIKNCTPQVKPGDCVFLGQLIAESDSGDRIHSPFSGKVAEISEALLYSGEKTPAITIENDFRDTPDKSVTPFGKKISECGETELIEQIKNKGITESVFERPVWKKLENAMGKVKTLVVNCVETEPYLTSKYRILTENQKEIIGGVKILIRITGAKKTVFCVGDNMEDVADKFMTNIGFNKLFSVKILKNKYPQNNEKLLVSAISKKEVPFKHGTTNIGYIVFEPETLKAVYEAFVSGLPFIRKTVTVSGEAVGEPSNIVAPIGASFEDLISFSGGYKFRPDKIIAGGPMTGVAVTSGDTRLSKGVEAVILTEKKIDLFSGNCIRCGRCVEVCPMNLAPLVLSELSVKKKVKKAKNYGIMVCSECGACSYVCPSKVKVLENIKQGKALLKSEE